MKVICAWCGADLGDKEPLGDKRVSHSICVECLAKEIKRNDDFNSDKEVELE